MKKTFTLILALCMVAVVFSGCAAPAATTQPSAAAPSVAPPVAQSATAAPVASQRDKVVVCSSNDGGSFDPFTRSAWGNIAMGELIFQKLLRWDNQGRIRLELAKSVDKVDDTHYTIKLWDNIVDSAGNHLKASDVVWSIQKFIDAGNKGGVNKLDHLDIVDDYTLTWVCNAPFVLGELEKNMSNPGILCQAAYEASTDKMVTDPVGTGPYKMKSYVTGSSVVLEVRDDFWMNLLPDDVKADLWIYNLQNVRTIEYQIIKDASQRAMALEMGTIQIADALNAADIDAFQSNKDITTIKQPVDPPVAFLFNCGPESPCQDINLRYAILYAINNAAIAEGLACPAYPIFGIQPNMFDALPEWKTGTGVDYYNFNLDKARECLAKTSYKGEELTMMYMSNTANDGAAILMQSELKAIGVNLKLYCVEQSVANTEMWQQDKWDLRLETLGGGKFLSATVKRFWSTDCEKQLGGGMNCCFVIDKQLDDLFTALSASNTEANIRAWNEYFNSKAYAYGICCYYDQTACRSNIEAALGTRNAICPNGCVYK